MKRHVTASTLSVPRDAGRGLRWLGGAVLLVVMMLSFTRMAGGTVVAGDEAQMQQLVGTTLRYALPDGDYVERRFVSPSKARWRLLTGAHRDDSGEDAIDIVRVSPAVFFVNRIDPIDGSTVSEVFNLSTQTVAIFQTRADPEDPQHRIEQSSEGRIEIVKTAQPADAAATS